MLRFGTISQLGTGDRLGFARVDFDEIKTVSYWISLPSFGTKSIKKWCSLPINTQVAVMMHPDGEQGIIVDALWSTTDTPPDWANANTDGVKYSDGTEMYYDAVSHKLTIKIASNGIIEYNNGTLDGMVKVNDLVTKLNNLENKLNTFMNTTFNLHTHAVPALGTSAVPIPVNVGSLTPTIKADLENTKIKQ